MPTFRLSRWNIWNSYYYIITLFEAYIITIFTHACLCRDGTLFHLQRLKYVKQNEIVRDTFSAELILSFTMKLGNIHHVCHSQEILSSSQNMNEKLGTTRIFHLKRNCSEIFHEYTIDSKDTWKGCYEGESDGFSTSNAAEKQRFVPSQFPIHHTLNN